MNKYLFMLPLWLASATASAAQVTFNSPAFPGSSGRVEHYTENGIKLGGAFTHTDTGLAGNPFNGSAFIQYEGYSSLSIGTVSGARFNLMSIDIAELNINYAQPATVTFIAQRPGSVMVSQSFTIDGLIGEGADFETFYFGSEFQNIEYAYIAEMPKDWISVYSFDNIRAEPVPLPAAAWLFISGMVSLMRLGAKRKK